jgi:hypothetical protein
MIAASFHVFVKVHNGSGHVLELLEERVVAALLDADDLRSREGVLQSGQRLPQWKHVVIVSPQDEHRPVSPARHREEVSHASEGEVPVAGEHRPHISRSVAQLPLHHLHLLPDERPVLTVERRVEEHLQLGLGHVSSPVHHYQFSQTLPLENLVSAYIESRSQISPTIS